jgi:RNA polymerase sigma factor (sigma-70 family)
MKIKKTNEELVALIQSGTDVQENMTLLLKQNQGLVMLIAKRMPTSSVVDFADLVQEGNMGLMKAVDSFDESKGAFTTHAGFYIRGTILRNTEGVLYDKRLPTHIHDLISKYKQFSGKYKAEHGEWPSDDEVLQNLQISKTALKDLKRTLQEANSVSLDDIVPGAEDLTVGEHIADPVEVADMVIENLYQNHCGQILWNHLEALGGLNGMVLIERFFENKTLQEIADKYNLTKQRIEQIEKKALGVLKKQDELRALIDADFDYDSEALKYTGFMAWKENMESSVERAVRKKENWDGDNQNRIDKLQSAIIAEKEHLETLKTRLLGCEAEQRKQIEKLFKHQFDEIVPHVLELSPKAMQTFILIYVCGMKGSEVAKKMDVGKSAVSMNKSFAISKIQAALEVQ